MSSQAYTPGLKRKESYIVEKTRRLPVPGEVLVKEGDTVTHDAIVARAMAPGEPHIVNVVNDLGLDTAVDNIEEYIVKKPGETIKEKEPVASVISFFGLFKKFSVSPINGIVEHVSKVTGQIIIREMPVPIELRAYIPGKVAQVIPREGVVIQTPAAFIQGIIGIGGETHGELMTLSKTPADELEAEQITPECAGKVLIGGSLVTLDALRKAVKIGVKGIVVGGIRDKDLTDFCGYEMGIAITGQEEVGLTLIMTEGFGKMVMSERTFTLLNKFEGELACINGATQIRAGVMRPEIIIPRKNIPKSQLKDESTSGEGLISGTSVRIIREPYFGALGKVSNLIVELQTIETESKVRVLEVELDNGEKVIVPRANVEIIEE